MSDVLVQTAEEHVAAADTMARQACGLLLDAYAICTTTAHPDLALLTERVGNADSTVAILRRFVSLRAGRLIGSPGTVDIVTPQIAPAWLRLGELLDDKGETADALDAYEHFVRYWERADAALQPTVERVRQRMAELRRGPDVERRTKVPRR